MPEIKSHGKLFFDKIMPADRLHPATPVGYTGERKIVSRPEDNPAQTAAGERTCRCGQ